MFFRYLYGEWLDLTGPYWTDSVLDSGQWKSANPVKQTAKPQRVSARNCGY